MKTPPGSYDEEVSGPDAFEMLFHEASHSASFEDSIIAAADFALNETWDSSTTLQDRALSAAQKVQGRWFVLIDPVVNHQMSEELLLPDSRSRDARLANDCH